MISATPEEVGIVRKILDDLAPGIEVRVFGSRTRSRHKRFSDLDLALMTTEPMALEAMAGLRDAFSESSLQYQVDILDWASTPQTMRDSIAVQLVPLRAATTAP